MTMTRPAPTAPAPRRPPRPASRAALVWVVQAVTGALVLVLVTVHMIANHFVVPDGLRSYEQVLDYLRNPFVVVLEAAFLVSVTTHALLGVRAVLLDLGPRPRVARLLDRALLALGIATLVYGGVLLGVIVARG